MTVTPLFVNLLIVASIAGGIGLFAGWMLKWAGKPTLIFLTILWVAVVAFLLFFLITLAQASSHVL